MSDALEIAFVVFIASLMWLLGGSTAREDIHEDLLRYGCTAYIETLGVEP